MLNEQHFSYALRTSREDVDKAISLLLLLEDSIEGIIRSYTPQTKLLGAENRQGVTCYLDALLFAMFARLDCFEAILYKSFNDDPRQKLAILLRFWVNMLRAGKLITMDLVRQPAFSFLSRSSSFMVPSQLIHIDETCSGCAGGLWLARCCQTSAARCIGGVYIHYRKARVAASDPQDGHLPYWQRRYQR